MSSVVIFVFAAVLVFVSTSGRRSSKRLSMEMSTTSVPTGKFYWLKYCTWAHSGGSCVSNPIANTSESYNFLGFACIGGGFVMTSDIFRGRYCCWPEKFPTRILNGIPACISMIPFAAAMLRLWAN